MFKDIQEKCTHCGLCVKECSFLARYGKPLDIIKSIEAGDGVFTGDMAFECSLCGLCTAVCPVSIELDRMFLSLREKAVQESMDLSPYRPILDYEKKGVSGAFTWYALPQDCDTVFFPGCSLPGSRPERTFDIYHELARIIPSLGIVLDCCTKPSHDLGRTSVFNAMFGELKEYLLNHGVKRVVTACTNCYQVFKKHGAPLDVRIIYEYLAEKGPDLTNPHLPSVTFTVHDPCVVRNEIGIHESIRTLINKMGFPVEEMPHSKGKTLCCGEGGSVPYIDQDLADGWVKKRTDEAGGRKIICYCAGCSYRLKRKTPADHILDLYFDPEKVIHGKTPVSHAPMTYIHRFLLKRRFKKTIPAVITRKRPFVQGGVREKNGMVKPIVFILFLACLYILSKYGNMGGHVTKEGLDHIMKTYGMMAPMIFILIYSITPVLFLPGLPLTLAAGVLFGPLWGVVYSIIGATSGACLSFLVTRYFARDFIMSKLRSPKWRSLDKRVEEHGWKVVAITRLIPLFPFNLLNYAFGLTRIGFATYAITTFICMLPACIAFIVFSSSLMDLVKGKFSAEFFVGILLIIIVSLFPVVYQKYKKNESVK